MAALPAKISIKWKHNHNIECAAALKFRPLQESVKQEFRGLLSNKRTPAEALSTYKSQFTEEGYVYASGDGGIMPNYHSVWR